MTDREKAIISAYTGIAMLTGDKFSIFHKYVEDILGRSVWTHELADRAIWEEIREKSKADFLALCAEPEPEMPKYIIKAKDMSAEDMQQLVQAWKNNMDKMILTNNDFEIIPIKKPVEWVPIKYRPMTSEERKKFAEHYGIEYCDTLEEKMFDCPMPEDGQHILLSRSWGVEIDVADNDIDGEVFIIYGLEGNGDWDGVDAWMPLPDPYKRTQLGGEKE